MLRETSDVLDRPIGAADGRLGTLEDLYFDDQTWRARYALVRTGLPLRRSYLLIAPEEMEKPAATDARMRVWLTRDEARTYPRLDARDDPPEVDARPQPRRSLLRRASARLGARTYPRHTLEEAGQVTAADPHLRSARSVRTYRLSARDGDAGHVRDLVFDDGTWTVCHVDAEVDLFLGKKRVLVPPQSIEDVSEGARAMRVGFTRHVLGGAPRFQRLSLMSRLYLMCVYDYYASSTGAPLMRKRRRSRRGDKVDARMLLSTME
jgi:hypothetical protein